MDQRHRSTRPRRWAAFAALAVVAVLAAACGGDTDDSATPADVPTSEPAAASDQTTPPTEDGCIAPQPLAERGEAKVVLQLNIENFAPTLLADHFGEFEKENLHVELLTAPSNEGTVMVATGQADLKLTGVTAGFLNAVNGGVDSVWIANQHQTSPDSKEGLWLRSEFFNEDGTVDVEKLRGARIAPGNLGLAPISSFQVHLFLEDHGLSLADVEIVSVGGTDMLVALENGAIDGGYVLTPLWLELEGGDVAQYVGAYGLDQGADRGSMYEMSRSFIDDEPEAARALIRALSRSICRYLQPGYHDDPEVLAALVELLGSTPDAIQRSPELIFDDSLPLYDGIITGAQEMWLEHAPELLDYDEPISIDRLTYHQLVEDALGQ